MYIHVYSMYVLARHSGVLVFKQFSSLSASIASTPRSTEVSIHRGKSRSFTLCSCMRHLHTLFDMLYICMKLYTPCRQGPMWMYTVSDHELCACHKVFETQYVYLYLISFYWCIYTFIYTQCLCVLWGKNACSYVAYYIERRIIRDIICMVLSIII